MQVWFSFFFFLLFYLVGAKWNVLFWWIFFLNFSIFNIWILIIFGWIFFLNKIKSINNFFKLVFSLRWHLFKGGLLIEFDFIIIFQSIRSYNYTVIIRRITWDTIFFPFFNWCFFYRLISFCCHCRRVWIWSIWIIVYIHCPALITFYKFYFFYFFY